MAEEYTWTVDTESDFGGRSDSCTAVRDGVPKLLGLFKAYNVRALWFISTELLRDYKYEIETIREHGHVLGSHGHFHINYKTEGRKRQDYEMSKAIINGPYRAPKFSFRLPEEPYSYPEGWSSLLKITWGLQKPTGKFYLHPFDITGDRTHAPSLFCKLWYSQPYKAWQKLIHLLNCYQTVEGKK